MPIYAGVSSANRQIKKILAGVSGTNRQCKTAWAGVSGVNRQVFASGEALSTFSPGDLVKIKENGAAVEFLALVHNYPTSGRTLLIRKDIYDERNSCSNNNYPYNKSDIKTWCETTYLNLIESGIRTQITAVPVICAEISASKYEYVTYNYKVFLLSVTELNGTSVPAEGELIPYFSTQSNRIALFNGVASEWWTRSKSLAVKNYIVKENGGVGSSVQASYSPSGSRPAFTLPSTILVDASGNVLAP